MNLIVLDTILTSLDKYFPSIINNPFPLLIMLFGSAVGIPIMIMNIVEKITTRKTYRYLFG